MALSKRWLKDLDDSIMRSRKRMQPFLDKRYEFVQEFVGSHYGDDTGEAQTPINLLEMQINTLRLELAGGNPRTMVFPKHDPTLQPEADDIRHAMDQLIDEIQLGEEFRLAVLDAMFLIGLIKTGRAVSDVVKIDGEEFHVGVPFADRIDPDDAILDMTARRWHELGYVGNLFRVPWDDFQESRLYKNKKEVEELGYTVYNEMGSERVESIGDGNSSSVNKDRRFAHLQSIWIADKKVTLTMPAFKPGPILRTVSFKGPRHGPFHPLGYTDVPSRIMPLSPAAVNIDLHVLANTLFCKLADQAERQKEINYAQAGAEKDAARIVNASDGDTVTVANPAAVQSTSFGGVDARSLAFFIETMELFKSNAGNLDLLAGIGPQSDTAKQDQMLRTAANRRVEDMRQRTIDWASKIVRDLTYYELTGYGLDRTVQKPVDGTDLTATARLTRHSVIGGYLAHNYDIYPYSMRLAAPAEQAQQITGFITQLLPLLGPEVEKQGGRINVQKIIETLADLTNLPVLKEIVKFDGVPMEVDTGQEPRGTKSPVTTRINERINRPGATSGGKSRAMIGNLMGAGQQPAELAGMLRSTG